MKISNTVYAGVIDDILLETRMVETSGPSYTADEKYVNGLPNFKVIVREHEGIEVSDSIRVTRLSPYNLKLDLLNFPPGSVIAFRLVIK